MVNSEGVAECSYLFGKEAGRGTEENFLCGAARTEGPWREGP